MKQVPGRVPIDRVSSPRVWTRLLAVVLIAALLGGSAVQSAMANDGSQDQGKVGTQSPATVRVVMA